MENNTQQALRLLATHQKYRLCCV